MMRRWVFSMFFAVGIWGTVAVSAEAACSGSRIEVATLPVVIGTDILAAWGIAPACDVIEAGLFVGTDPAALERAGRAVYALRSTYQEVVSVSESGAYWVAAYARDEDGTVIHSAPRLVLVAIPPALFSSHGPHGSHGAPPSYAGTDADFLKPAGEPHFASLRHFNFGTGSFMRIVGRFTPEVKGGSEVRSVGSTRPEEVVAGQAQPLTAGDVTRTPNSGDVLRSIDSLTQSFAVFGHPRPGLYVVECELRSEFETAGCGPALQVFRRDFGGLPFGFAELFSSLITPFVTSVTTAFTRASATYFIPGVSPESRLVSAKLRVGLFVGGDLSLVRISGKPPVSLDDVSCRGLVCTAFGTWDFTEEAASLAAQGGGELSVSADPIPLVVVQSEPPPFSLENQVGFWISRLDVNYPWSHGGELGALTLSFQQACPKELTVSVTPNTVLPHIPTIPPALVGFPKTATVDVLVKSCPTSGGAPASVDVTFKVEAPALGTDEAGGHAPGHLGARPKGTFGARFDEGGRLEAMCLVILDAQGMGTCQAAVTYHPHRVSGVETIVATAPGIGAATAKITVQVQGLVELPEDLARYVLVGTPANHAGTNDPCRDKPPTSGHFQNHHGVPGFKADGSPFLIEVIKLIAERMLRETGILLRVNDMSLPLGGLFDIRNNWSPPHGGHRVGLEVDIGLSGIRSGVCAPYDLFQLERAIFQATERLPVLERDQRGNPTHFHGSVR